MENELSIAFIGGTRAMAARASRAGAKVCAVSGVHVIDINEEDARAARAGETGAEGDSGEVRTLVGRLFAAETRNMQGVVAWTRQWRCGIARLTRSASDAWARGWAGAGVK
ncbi:hypothetical protein [Achromobacter sp. UBA4530]|uniref:hypothetical protein n=1 Tax=Achromobacter sp. UBA4530 TaxID=1945912 RepID=UPI00257D95A0|nr:hypothetical protein [Achromobacter sp. UBA4530]